MQHKISAINTKVAQLVEKANELYGITLPHIAVRCDLRGRSAGQAIHCWNEYSMRFNVDQIHSNFDFILNEVVPHELAHIVCMYTKTDSGHGWKWRQTCIQLGGNGETRHKEEIIFGRGDTYEYTSTTGNKIRFSSQRHKQIQNGRVLRIKPSYGGGQIDSTCEFRIVGGAATAAVAKPAMPAQAKPAAAVARAANSDKPASNAQRFRDRIAQAKQHGEDPSVVIQFGIEVLGQSRALASTYLKNNWNKV